MNCTYTWLVIYVHACVRMELHVLRELRESSTKIDDLKRKQLNEELQRWRFYFYFLSSWVTKKMNVFLKVSLYSHASNETKILRLEI